MIDEALQIVPTEFQSLPPVTYQLPGPRVETHIRHPHTQNETTAWMMHEPLGQIILSDSLFTWTDLMPRVLHIQSFPETKFQNLTSVIRQYQDASPACITIVPGINHGMQQSLSMTMARLLDAVIA